MDKKDEKPGLWERNRPRVLSAIIYNLARSIVRTIKINIINPPPCLKGEPHDGMILLGWHGRSIIPAYVFTGKGFLALISLSRDGEIQNHIFQRFGFKTIRGSTGRGGLKAALMASKRVRDGEVLSFTPDGPRGPIYQAQMGALIIAQKSGRPIYCAGNAANPAKFIPTWDKYMIPMPFGRAEFVFGDAIWVPAEADEQELEAIRKNIQNELNRLQQEAEDRVGLK